jgi:hypothetical protein
MTPRDSSLAIILAFAVKRPLKRNRWVKVWLARRHEKTHIKLLNEIELLELSKLI